MTAPEQHQRSQGQSAFRILWMALATGAECLIAQAFLHTPCWSLFFLAALTAVPLWHYQKEYALFHRRVVLTGVTLEDS